MPQTHFRGLNSWYKEEPKLSLPPCAVLTPTHPQAGQVSKASVCRGLGKVMVQWMMGEGPRGRDGPHLSLGPQVSIKSPGLYPDFPDTGEAGVLCGTLKMARDSLLLLPARGGVSFPSL